MNDPIPDDIRRPEATEPRVAWSTVRGTLGVTFWLLFASLLSLATWNSSGPEVAIGTSLSFAVIGSLASLGEKQRSSEQNMTGEQRAVVFRETCRATTLALLLGIAACVGILYAMKQGPVDALGPTGACLCCQVAPAVLFGRSNGRAIVREMQLADQEAAVELSDRLRRSKRPGASSRAIPPSGTEWVREAGRSRAVEGRGPEDR